MNPFLSELKKQGDLNGFDTRKIAQADREYITPGMTEAQRRELRKQTDRLRELNAWKMINDVRSKMGDMGI